MRRLINRTAKFAMTHRSRPTHFPRASARLRDIAFPFWESRVSSLCQGTHWWRRTRWGSEELKGGELVGL
jgi:hypothetical protein